MAPAAVVCGGFVALILFILQTIAIATPHWFEYSSTLYGGLFKICVKTSGLFQSDEICYTYASYTTDLVTFNYIAYTALNVIGCVLLFASVIVGIVGCASSRPGRPTVQNLSGICITAVMEIIAYLYAVFPYLTHSAYSLIIAGAVWFYVVELKDTSVFTLIGGGLDPGYSFYLAAVAGGGSLVFGIIMCIVGNQMEPVPTVTPMAPGGPQVIVMHTQQGQAVSNQSGFTGYTQTIATNYP